MSLWESQSNILVAPVVVLLYSLTASHTGCTAFGWKKSQLCWHWLQSTSEGLLTLLLGLSTRVGLRHTASRQLLLENTIWIQIVSQAIFLNFIFCELHACQNRKSGLVPHCSHLQKIVPPFLPHQPWKYHILIIQMASTWQCTTKFNLVLLNNNHMWRQTSTIALGDHLYLGK